MKYLKEQNKIINYHYKKIVTNVKQKIQLHGVMNKELICKMIGNDFII